MKNPRTQFLPNFSVMKRQKSLKKKPAYRLITVERSYLNYFLFQKAIYVDRVQFGPIQEFTRNRKNSLPAQAGENFLKE